VYLDKAPDAFRTISEVADDLDIPQHVLRFWETRFTQIKPMKRSGGRRYYRPDDVDLLKGIRRLLYGEGYTIRGVQRILKEHGIKSVQGLVDGSSAPAFGQIDQAATGPVHDDDEHDHDHDDVEAADTDDEEEEEIEAAPAARRAPEIGSPAPRLDPGTRPSPHGQVTTAPRVESAPAAPIRANKLDTARLETVLQDLIACRALLDSALKDG
jgi:DNA-binding transcriptional MerR regulator